MKRAKPLGLTRDDLRRIVDVAHAHSLGFVELVGLADLDPATAFRGATIRGSALRGQDLAGFDFTGAILAGCDLTGTDLSRTNGVTEAMLAEAAVDTTTILPSPSHAAFWATGQPPSWAEDWGHDEYGPWVSFRVPGTEVTQRMRWIPPGQFMMGSPETERGRDGDEGPLHEVTFDCGFWMFETACAELLWFSVMRESRGRTRGSDFPATGVSWNDAQDFAGRLNELLPGLAIGLASEAEWEYACRADTDTAYSFGSRIRKNLVHYGRDRSAGPVAVGSLPPNRWGLHEMHGNVWEWCEDASHNNYVDAPAYGDAWWDGGGAAGRVLRGGAWFEVERFVRAACRDRFVPGGRSDNIGFRCVRGGHFLNEAEVAAPADQARGRRRGAPPPAWAAGAATERSAERKKISVPRTTAAPEIPAWATAAGTDQFGTWADIEIPALLGPAVTQRLRLIPPGHFMMGSPKSETGRFENEGPRRRVAIQQAFWLFDTPCTQALWQVVMGDNPSDFKSPERPVEKVSFEDVQRFLARVNDFVPGLELVLPSEARWEYACRAGTGGATYAGPLQILGIHNAPILDRIAWYGGNSGIRFELKNGVDTSTWPEKQSNRNKAGTHPVKKKDPNAWGLYDMLGNVWEWCKDPWSGGQDQNELDGESAVLVPYTGAGNVIRGGAWNTPARAVRAASRRGNALGFSAIDLGFRCARGLD